MLKPDHDPTLVEAEALATVTAVLPRDLTSAQEDPADP